MVYRVMLEDGVSVECENAVDVALLLQALNKSTRLRGAPPDQPPDVYGFWNDISDVQRGVLEIIGSVEDEIRLEDIRMRMKLESPREVSVLLGNARKVAERHGVPWQDILSYRIVGARQDRTSVYRPGTLLKELMEREGPMSR